MQRGAQDDYFWIFFVVWAVLGVLSWAFFAFSKNVELKRQAWPPMNIAAGLLLLGFMWFMSRTDAPGFLLVMVPIVGLITFLNIRTMKFCNGCARMIPRSNPFSASKFCPKCGAPVERGG